MIESFLADLRDTSLPEALTVVFGMVYGILAIRRIRWCWVAGGIASAILGVLSWQAKLPMQAFLQLYYVGMAVYGFWHWSRDSGKTREVSLWPMQAHLLSIVGILVLSVVNARYFLSETGLSETGLIDTGAAWPFLDSLTLFGSLFATWLTAQVKLENWLYWIVFDAIAVFLYASQGLMFVALQFVAYLVIAAIGFVTWLRSRRELAPSV